MPTVPTTFVLKDLLDEEISGTFYQQEIQKVSESTEPIYRIEKVIRQKKTKGITKYFVKWLGYPDKFNSWIEDKDLQWVFILLRPLVYYTFDFILSDPFTRFCLVS